MENEKCLNNIKVKALVDAVSDQELVVELLYIFSTALYQEQDQPVTLIRAHCVKQNWSTA